MRRKRAGRTGKDPALGDRPHEAVGRPLDARQARARVRLDLDVRLLQARHDDAVAEPAQRVALEHVRVGDEVVQDLLRRVRVRARDGLGAREVLRVERDRVDGVLVVGPLRAREGGESAGARTRARRGGESGRTIDRSPVRIWIPMTKFSGSANRLVYWAMKASAAGFGRRR